MRGRAAWGAARPPSKILKIPLVTDNVSDYTVGVSKCCSPSDAYLGDTMSRRLHLIIVQDQPYLITGQPGSWSLRDSKGTFIGGCRGLTGAEKLATQHARGELRKAPSHLGRRSSARLA